MAARTRDCAHRNWCDIFSGSPSTGDQCSAQCTIPVSWCTVANGFDDLDGSRRVFHGIAPTSPLVSVGDCPFHHFLRHLAGYERGYLEMVDNPEADRLKITGEGTWIKAVATRLGNKYQLLAANYDEKGMHTELVPVSFINLSGQGGVYILKTVFAPGTEIVEEIATSAAVIQKYIPMSANSVVFMELEQKATPLSTQP